MAKTVVEREIRFFRIDCGFQNNGEPRIFDPKSIFEHVKKLSFKDGSNYCDDEGKVLGCWVNSTDDPCKIVLANIRRTDLPLIEYKGELSPLEIPEQAGLSEQTHIVFLGNNIVGCDINYYGPRISRLAFYLSEKAIRVAPEYVTCNPILRRDVYQQLQRFESIKMLRLKVRASHIETIANVNESLGDALKAALKAGGDDGIDVELILKASRSAPSPLSERLFESIKRLVKKPDIHYDVETLKVKGYSIEAQKSIELDLLSDKLVIKREISKLSSKSKGLVAASAFRAIISAYEEIKDEIEKSPSVLL